MAVADGSERTPANPSPITQAAIDKAIDAAVGMITARIDGIEKAQEVFQADLTRVPTTVDRQIVGLRDILQTRLDDLEKTVERMQGELDKREHDIVAAIQHLRDLVFGKIEELASVTAERFEGIKSQFLERDTRTDQRAGDTKLAVDAAFAAAKEATAKIEAGFSKSIDGQQELMSTTAKATEDKINDIKDRMSAMENRYANITMQRADNRESNADARANLALIVSAIGVLVLVGLHFIK